MLTFDYEFNFLNGYFEQSIYDQCTITDTNTDLLNNRQSLVESTVNNIMDIFTNIKGLNIFSTFINYNQHVYKITMKRLN